MAGAKKPSARTATLMSHMGSLEVPTTSVPAEPAAAPSEASGDGTIPTVARGAAWSSSLNWPQKNCVESGNTTVNVRSHP